MDLNALKDLRTTGPGLAVMIVQYLVTNHIVSADLGNIFFQVISLAVGIVLLAINSKTAPLPGAPLQTAFIGAQPATTTTAAPIPASAPEA